MELTDAIRILNERLAAADAVRDGGRESAEFPRWRNACLIALENIFGTDHMFTSQFGHIDYNIPGGTILRGDPATAVPNARAAAFVCAIEHQRGILLSALDHLRDYGIPTPVTPLKKSRARIFITHGHADEVLDAVVHFIQDDLGLTPVIVKREPSGGASVDDRVEGLMDSCDAVVILATADDLVSDVRQPRPNVIHEVGLAQAKKPTRVIYLKEEGATFPSNVGPKIWESFVRGNYGPVFSKITRELRGLDLL